MNQHKQVIEAALRMYRKFDDERTENISTTLSWVQTWQEGTPNEEDTRERLAEYAHAAWSGWMEYLFGKCENETGEGPSHFPTGNLVMPQWEVERWTRQMNTPYAELPEGEKESDRAEADKMLAIAAPAPQPATTTGQPRGFVAGRKTP